jgi:aspartyl-tRNA(Asn)/glutamyl-tRNA(Gln) amidotransferase subunit B
VAYAKALHALVRWIGICDGNMQEGSFRCDANVSVRPMGSDKLGTRCEIKNLNSFRFMEQAIEYEAKRQIAVLEDGGKIDQETRLFDPDRNETRSMRSKEDAQDYRYFPDPDLLPLVVTEDQIEKIKRNLPELPDQMSHRLQSEYGIAPQTASLLTSEISRGKFFDGAAKLAMAVGLLTDAERREVVRDIANATVGELTARLNDKGLDFPELPFSAGDWMQLRLRVFRQEISRNSAKEVLDAMLAGEGAADQIIDRRGLRQVSNAAAIEKVVDDVLAANAKQVADFKSGKEKAFQSLVGQVMKATKGKANPAQVNEILRRKLGG